MPQSRDLSDAQQLLRRLLQAEQELARLAPAPRAELDREYLLSLLQQSRITLHKLLQVH